MAIALFPLLLLLIIFISLGFGLVLWLANPAKDKSGEMACGHCGYAVRGLDKLTCPECGADLRDVGIKPQSKSGSRKLGIALTSVSAVLLLGACVLSGVFYAFTAGSSVTPKGTTTLRAKEKTSGVAPEEIPDDEPVPAEGDAEVIQDQP